jgi:N utilization substance protein A
MTACYKVVKRLWEQSDTVKNEFELAFNEIAELRALPQEIVLEALQTALVSAYQRNTNASKAQHVEATIDPETGRARLFVEKEVVEEVLNPNTEVDLETARYYHPECELGMTVMVQVEGTTKKFGRIAAQTAKQVILQKIREAERSALYDEYKDKEGDIVNGTVQSIAANKVTISLGRAEAELPRQHQIPGERYRQHDKIRCYVLEVKKSPRGPQIILSRSHRNMLRRLLEFEVPEIYNGQIEIKNIAREAGYRSKVAVMALQEGIDPVGACVGMRGIRIQNIVNELNKEKIDVIEWNPNQEEFIEKALSPARVTGVFLDDDPDSGRTAVVVVRDEHLSLAIGREGQNARLAAKLTGWRIDIKSVTESVSSALENIDKPPLDELTVQHPDLLSNVIMIMEKRQAGRVITEEEWKELSRFAVLAERRYVDVRNKARAARVAEINAVKETLPQAYFDIPVSALDLPDNMIEALEPLGNVGEIMLRFLIDETRLKKLLGTNNDAQLRQVQTALDKLVIPEQELPKEEKAINVVDEEISVEAQMTDIPGGAPVVQPQMPEAVDNKSKGKTDDLDEKFQILQSLDAVLDYDDDEDDDVLRGKRKKEKQKRRQLVYDEDTGQTFAKRRRKGGRKNDSWDGDDF